MRQGIETGKFGSRLRELLESQPNSGAWHVYYDHGDKSSDPHVAAIKGSFGGDLSNSTRLSDLDILIGSSDKKAQFLIEIEERSCSPKKILGDLFAALLCDRFDVKTKEGRVRFEATPETRLIVCGIQPAHGKRIKKINDTITPRLHALSSTPNGILPQNIALIFTKSINETLNLVKDEIARVLGLPT